MIPDLKTFYNSLTPTEAGVAKIFLENIRSEEFSLITREADSLEPFYESLKETIDEKWGLDNFNEDSNILARSLDEIISTKYDANVGDMQIFLSQFSRTNFENYFYDE